MQFALEDYIFETMTLPAPRGQALPLCDLESRMYYWLRVEYNLYCLVYLPSFTVMDIAAPHTTSKVGNITYLTKTETALRFVTMSGHVLTAQTIHLEDCLFPVALAELLEQRRTIGRPFRHETTMHRFLRRASVRLKELERNS